MLLLSFVSSYKLHSSPNEDLQAGQKVGTVFSLFNVPILWSAFDAVDDCVDFPSD
jgi:hypothetical protein